ncbi:MAG: ribonuclease J [Magnetococcales bacterium]|nr:ribonuclease J [Magnetococcales bacterium]
MEALNSEPTQPIGIIPLGGLGEVGMNLMVYRCGEQLLVVDCGLTFPEGDTPGVDFIIPDTSYLVENRDRVLAIVITHGHEDHQGALPYIWPDLQVPVYCGAMTLGILEGKLKEHDLLGKVPLILVRQGDRVQIGPFMVHFIPVTHSIIDASALAITTPLGTLIHTGDFNIDHTPGDPRVTDLFTLADYGQRGVLALLSDSTNVGREGSTASERIAHESLAQVIPEIRGLAVVALFSSNIRRVRQVLQVAHANGRKVILNGRSLVQNVAVAREQGFLDVPPDLLIDVKAIDQHPRNKVLVISTGSQGEPNSSLVRIASGEHREIALRPGDTVILSSRFIPGNERTIWSLVNRLAHLGAQVIHENNHPRIHVSGHAPREDLKLMLALTRPRYFIPIHGELRHLHMHRDLAVEMGIPPENTLVATNGNRLELDATGLRLDGEVPHGRVFVDGKGVGDVSDIVLRDRRHLSEDGMVVAVLVVAKDTGVLLEGPELLTRGVVYEDENQDLLESARQAVQEALRLGPKGMDFGEDEEVGIQDLTVRALRRFFKKRLGRRPVVLPLVMEM